MYSHFRLKAKSLRTQLDHWLAMEDLNNGNGKAGTSSSSKLHPAHSGQPFHDDVQKLKQLLSQLDPDTSPLRPPVGL
jgi:myosin protein heavy chain